MFRRQLLPCALALAVLSLAIPAVSAGAVRYATPTGSNAGVCNPTPCTLQRAVNLASDGDQVVVAGGEYKPTVEVEVDNAVDVGGQQGAPLPVVKISNHFFYVKDAGAKVHDLRIEVVEPTMPYAISVDAGRIERVYAYSLVSAGACQIERGSLVDSVCWGGLIVSGSGAGNFHVDLRNVTATTTSMGAHEGAKVTIDGANLIMRSIDPATLDGADLGINVSIGASATVNLSHSSYATVSTSLSSGTNFTYTAPGTNGNQIAPPLFVDAAAGDLHQLAGSPTIDAGVTDPLIGATDLDGAPRSQPHCIGATPIPDIGAYESAPVACPGPPSPTSIAKPSNLFGFGQLKRNKRRGTASLAIAVPGPGRLTLSGKGLVEKHVTLRGSETVRLTVKAKGKAAKKLRTNGKLKVRVAIAFVPTGGDPNTQTTRLKLIRND